MSVRRLTVEVVFALPDRQELKSLRVVSGTSVGHALELSGIDRVFSDWDLTTMPIAVWGRPVGRDELLKDGDRVEVLRPLRLDPRDARRQLAKDGQFMGGSGIGESD